MLTRMTSLSTNHAFCLERDEDSGDLDVNLNGPIGVKSRWSYAQLHVQSMGIDLTTQPMLEQPDGDNNLLSEKEVDEAEQQDLPEGWERHLDDDGPYYWHIRTGTIQRERPREGTTRSLPTPESRPLLAPPPEPPAAQPQEDCVAGGSSSSSSGEAMRFAVRSLGWSEIPESELTPERSSRALNRCIVDLSLGRGLDGVGRWGEGRSLLLELDGFQLRLLRPQDGTVLHCQPLHAIRVWGVGRDNGRERDFAYVARDSGTRRFMCHVFRCDMPARIIANALRDVCKKMVLERSLSDPSGDKRAAPTEPPARRVGSALDRLASLSMEDGVEGGLLRPMEEPRKVLRALYLGSMPVAAAAGIDLLNGAIDTLLDRVPRAHWLPVQVAVAPSTVTVTLDPAGGGRGQVLAECRVRFLSFLGIGKEVTNCGFIVHTAQDQFEAHVLHCEPSAGALCKTIEAACKLRYQKCLDAHRQANNSPPPQQQPTKALSSLKGVLGSIVGRAMGVVQQVS
uniref:Beta amyloid binding protein n=1 Tax=Rhipicephalus zambeziensis TaxID=60191 RepID=A0A224YUG2_9ACAR